MATPQSAAESGTVPRSACSGAHEIALHCASVSVMRATQIQTFDGSRHQCTGAHRILQADEAEERQPLDAV